MEALRSSGRGPVGRIITTGALLALLAAPGCGESDDSTVTAQEAIAAPCRLLDAGDVEDVLGTEVTAARERLAVGAVRKRGCEYASEDEDADAGSAYGLVDTGWRPKASIVALPHAGADRSLARPGSAFEQVEGLGDAAFVVPPHESLFVRSGEITLVVDVGNYLHAHGSPAAHEQLRSATRELARRALERLVK